MTKKKLHESVLALCSEHKASKKLTDALDELTKPKVGGSSDVADYTVFGEDGSVEYVFCTYHKMWEPVVAVATDDEGNEVEFSLFKVNDKTKNGYERECIEGTAQWKEQTKAFNATKAAIVEDLMEEKISGTDAKDLMAKAEEARAKHPSRTDGLGEATRPGGEPTPTADAEEEE